MKLSEICTVLRRLEQEYDVNSLKVGSLLIWPLVRQQIWGRLGSSNGSSTRRSWSYGQLPRKLYERALCEVRGRVNPHTNAELLILSRDAFVQEIGPAGLGFDRIADPIMSLSQFRWRTEKRYFNTAPTGRAYLPAPAVQAPATLYSPDLDEHLHLIQQIYLSAGLDPETSVEKLKSAIRRLVAWHTFGHELFRNSSRLKTILLAAWYFPDAMGLIAAAKHYGIQTIDVQHGKQGRYQGMYSWWTSIPDSGYQVMPDLFWCWGEPSRQHILASSPDRNVHKPVVGGYPWPGFYQRFVSTSGTDSQQRDRRDDNSGGTRILFTLQGRSGAHQEPIPDWVIDGLKSWPGEIEMRFRIHPNAKSDWDYCRKRLSSVEKERYSFSDPRRDLFGEMLWATHHITAFSSCCYEAEIFKVPTLLFGQDGQEIYSEEITSGRFSWTDGSGQSLSTWLSKEHSKQSYDGPAYAVTDLDACAETLQQFCGNSA